MPGKLKPLDVERETRSGKYPDGDGLYLVVASPTSNNWRDDLPREPQLIFPIADHVGHLRQCSKATNHGLRRAKGRGHPCALLLSKNSVDEGASWQYSENNFTEV